VSAVKGSAIPKLDAFFKQGAQATNASLNALANQLAGQGMNLSQLNGAGATAHTVYSVQPKGGGQPSSQATQCTWAMQKLKAGGPASTPAARRPVVLAASATDPLVSFIDTFATSVGGNGALANQWQQVQQGAQSLGQSSSASEFLTQGLAELVRILALLVDGVLAVSQAFLDGLLEQIAALVSALFDAHSGLLNQELDIPVLSWLYQKLFDQPLTLLNVAMLVVAVPVTILWRIVAGAWPSQSVGVQATRQLGGASSLLQTLLGLGSAIFIFVSGLASAILDALGEATEGATFLGTVVLVCGVLSAVVNIPIFTNPQPSGLDWAAWGALLGLATLNIFSVLPLGKGPAAVVLGYLLPFQLMLLSGALIYIFITQWLEKKESNPIQSLTFTVGILGVVPGLINPVKLLPVPAALLVAIVDGCFGVAVAAVSVFLVFKSLTA
jgi:hypothetical protein